MSMAWYRGEDNPMSPHFDAAKYPEADMVCEGCCTTFPESEIKLCPLSGMYYCPECMEEEAASQIRQKYEEITQREEKAALTEAAFNNN